MPNIEHLPHTIELSQWQLPELHFEASRFAGSVTQMRAPMERCEPDTPLRPLIYSKTANATFVPVEVDIAKTTDSLRMGFKTLDGTMFGRPMLYHNDPHFPARYYGDADSKDDLQNSLHISVIQTGRAALISAIDTESARVLDGVTAEEVRFFAVALSYALDNRTYNKSLDEL